MKKKGQSSSLTKFKRRISFTSKFKLFFNKSASIIFFWHTVKLEYVYFKLVRRKLRFLLKKKKSTLVRKVWLNLKANYPISKKSKNSRMGKGKGKFLRWLIILKPMQAFLELDGFNFLKLVCFKKTLKHFFLSKPAVATLQLTSNSWANLKKIKFLNSPNYPKDA